MDTSDPYISSLSLSYRQETRVRKPLPSKVIELLEEPNVVPAPAARPLFQEEPELVDEGEDEDHEEVVNIVLDREPLDFETD